MNNNENKSLSKKNQAVELSILNHPSANSTFKPEFAPMSNSLYYYIASNFFQILGIDIITKDNFHHIIDSFRAYRTLMRNLGLVELVDSMNYALDYLAKYLPVEPEKRYLYREKDYRTPRIELYFSENKNDITEIPSTVKDEGTSFLSHFLEDSLCENIYSSKSTLTDKTKADVKTEVAHLSIAYEPEPETAPPTPEPQNQTATQIAKVEKVEQHAVENSKNYPAHLHEQQTNNDNTSRTIENKFKHVSDDVQNMIKKIKKQGQK